MLGELLFIIIIINNIYIYIIIYFEGMESSVILVRCPQMMLLKQCIRRAVQEGLIHPSGHAFFSSFPIQSIICNARPFDVPCSF